MKKKAFVIIFKGLSLKDTETTFLEDESPTFLVSNIVQRRKKTNSLCELENYIKNSKAKISKIHLNCN